MTFKSVVIRVLPLIYFLLVSLPHHPFSRFLDDDFIIPYGYETMQLVADIGSVLLLFVIVLLGIRVARVHRAGAFSHLAFWFVLVALMYAADRYLIVNNIERIHFPQYALLSVLLGMSLRSESLIFFVSCFGGFVDEFLQFAMNPAKTNYLDFNDIVLNILGAALGVAVLLALRRNRAEESPAYEGRVRLFFNGALVALGSLVLLGLVSGRIVGLVEQAHNRSVFAAVNGKLSFILSFENHDKFWQVLDYGKLFHVMTPPEGLVLTAFLLTGIWLSIRWLRGVRDRSHGLQRGPLGQDEVAPG